LNFENIQLDDSFVWDLPIPLVDARLTLGDLLENVQGQNIVADPITGLLKLVYQTEYEYDFSDLNISIPNQEVFFEGSIPVPPGSLFPDDSIVGNPIPFSLQFANNPNNSSLRIDTILTQAMKFELNLLTTIRNKTRIDLESPNIIDASGRPFSRSIHLNGVTTGTTQRADSIIDLSNYRIVPDQSRPQQINFAAKIVIFRDMNAIEPYNAGIQMTVKLEDIEVDLIYGFLGRETLPIQADTIDLPIMDKFTMDLLEIDKADVILTVTSELGVPILISGEISTLTHNPERPVKTLLLDDRVNPPQTPFAPPAVFTKPMDIKDLINDNLGKLPYQVVYSIAATTNPNPEDANLMNFLSKNSLLKMAVNVEIPLKLRVGGLTISDTISFGGLPFSEGVESFTIKANMHNAFPLDAAVFLHFLDSNKRAIDSVNISTIAGGHVVGGRVTRPTVSQIDINLSSTQIKNLVNTRYFRITGVINTSNAHEEQMIGIYEDSGDEGFLRVMLGCRIRISGGILDNFRDLFNQDE
jgi:aspartate 1-decarboxylase